MRVVSGFHQQGLWGGAGWFEVRFYQGFTRVPPEPAGWSGVV